jgi:GNAT superfamily N-acetyltransferase
MADIDQAAVVRLRPGDAPAGLLLSTEAHWDQNEADWRFFLDQGTVFGVRDNDGRLVASAALLPYSSGNAWISMVLVTESWRRRGLATRLVDACLAAAAGQGLTTWLDATPAGAMVYGPLGFRPTLQLRRLRSSRRGRPKPKHRCRRLVSRN